MSQLTLAGEFFVAGEPVEPNRPCYVERSADRRLAAAVAARRTALVFGPPALGKTSLIIRCAARLHTAGECVGYVDLADPSLEGDAGTPTWCHEVGARIAQYCGLRPEPGDSRLEAYAAEGGRALADFLWHVVLTNTTKPITVFIDSIEHVAGTERARIVFDMIGACRLRRAEEPDYGRISFVVAGVATRRRLWTATAGAPPFPFDAIALDDFTPREAYKLARGFGGDVPQTRALLDRILTWTSGHPYLTQKIARGVAAKGGRLEHVEQVVETQLLAPQALAEEPLFADVRRRLERDSRPVRQARALLAAVANGREQVSQAEAAALDELVLAGLVTSDANGGAVRFRNRLLREVFVERVVVGSSTKRHLALAAAVLAAAGALGAFWYTQRLPQPAVAVLSSADAPLPALAAAYAELNALPGFTERANELYVAALVERSAAASTFAEAAAVDELLASAGYEALATRLLGDFWLRRAAAEAHAGERDAALLYAAKAEAAAARRPIEVAPLEAASLSEPAAPVAAAESVADAVPRAQAALAMLVDHDYPALEYSGRFAEEPLEQRIDWRDSSFTLRYGDALRRVPLTAAPVALAPAAVPTALAPNPLVREILVQEEGSAGSFVLEIEIEHDDLGELTATLTAPSGARVELPVTSRVAQGVPIVATPGSTLGTLADEARGGTWRLAVVDRRSGGNGSLRAWRLAFSAEQTWVDAPPLPLAIPDPARTEQVAVTLGRSGRFAVAQPAEPGGVDSVAVWDLTAGELVAELALTAPVTAVELSPDDARLLVVTGDALTLSETATGREIARIETQTAFLRAPLFAIDGSHFLIAERSDAGAPLVSLLRASDGALVASMEGIVPGDSAVLGPNASFLAFVSGPRTVTLLDPRVGQGRAELEHAQAVVALWPVASEGVLTVDAAGALRVWPLARNVTQAQARFLGTTVDANSVSVAARSTRVAYAAARGHVLVRDARDGALLFDARVAASHPPAALLAPAGDALVTLAGNEFRYWTLRGAASDVPDGTDALDVAAVALDGMGRLVVGSRDGSVRAVAAAEPRAASDTIAFLGHTVPVSVLAVASEAGVAASGARDGSVRIWSLATGEPDATVLRHGSEPVTALALARDGKWLASGTLTGLRLFSRAADGFKDRAVAGGVRALAFTPNGERVAVGAGDGSLLLVHAASGDARTVPAGGAPIQSVAFAPQGDIFASGDAAGGVRLWRTTTLSAQGEAHGVHEPVRWLGFGPDGRSLYVVTDHWAHRLRVTDRRLEPVASRRLSVAGGLAPAIAASGSGTLAIAGLDARGMLTRFEIDLETPLPSGPMPRGPSGPDPDRLRGRDWTSILGLAVDDDGKAVPVSQL